MATAYVYTASKRHNSTYQPTGGTSIDVQLKGGCDLYSPTFLLAHSGIPAYSMIQFDSKYYFVDRVRSVRDGLYEVDCTIDVLATWKTHILATSAYVLYYTHSNTELTDKRIGVKTAKTVQSAAGSFDLLGNGSGTNSVVIACITGEDSTGAYAITQADAKVLTSDLDNWYEDPAIMDQQPDVTDFTTAVEALAWMCKYGWSAIKQLFGTGHVAESIKSAIMLPLPFSAIGGFTENIQLGQYISGLQGTRINDRIYSDGCTVNIPWQASDWRRNAPYHEIYLYIPYIGVINISPSDVMGYSSLSVSCSIDLITGDSIFRVYNGNHTIGQYNTSLASAFPIGSSNITPVGAGTSLISGAAGIAGAILTGGATAVVAGTAGAMGLLNGLDAQPSTIGGNYGGAVLGLTAQAVCFTVFHDTVEDPHNISPVAGEPACEVMSLGSISGYVQTLAASVSGSMGDDERQEINRLLDGGIYIE